MRLEVAFASRAYAGESVSQRSTMESTSAVLLCWRDVVYQSRQCLIAWFVAGADETERLLRGVEEQTSAL